MFCFYLDKRGAGTADPLPENIEYEESISCNLSPIFNTYCQSKFIRLNSFGCGWGGGGRMSGPPFGPRVGFLTLGEKLPPLPTKPPLTADGVV